MVLLIRAARIVDPHSSFHLQTKDILVRDGRIEKVAQRIDALNDAEIFEAEGKCISPGWFDMYAHLCDPGFEYKEDIQSGMRAAAYGGFTAVVSLPDTFPVVDSKGGVEYVLNKSKGNIVDVLPVGAATKKCEGKELAEIYDMATAGAIAFSDAQHAVPTSGLMMRALLYVKKINGVIISFPSDETIAPNGQMNESTVSVEMGMNAIPALAEDLMVVRDIELAEYTQSRLHFSCISTKEAVSRIREAKKKGIPVTAGVNPVHLFLDDASLSTYDSNYKIFPPLRSIEDVAALKDGLLDGTIDVICSAHEPQNNELKQVEFEYASPGMINLETCYAVANMAMGEQMKPEMLVEKIAINPRKILNQPVPLFTEGSEANFTIFDPNMKWMFAPEQIQSKSKNSPFINQQLTGKAVAVFNHNQFLKL